MPVFRQSSVQKSLNLAAAATEGAKGPGSNVYKIQTLYDFFIAGRN
jgi:hypothetical protein